MELESQCVKPESLKSTISLLQKDLTEVRQKLCNYCNNVKRATRESIEKLRAKCRALRDNLKAAAVGNAEQERSIDFNKQGLANFSFKAAKKSEAAEKMDTANSQLRSDLQQLEHYNRYLIGQGISKKGCYH